MARRLVRRSLARTLALACCGLGLTSLHPETAKAGAAPVDIQAKLLFKVATFDAKLPPDVVRVAVVFPASSGKRGEEVVAAFKKLSGLKVSGRGIDVTELRFATAAEIPAKLASAAPYAVYVLADSGADAVAAIARESVSRGVLSFGEDPSTVTGGASGLAVSVEEEAGKRVIVFSPNAATRAGRAFDGALMSLARVVK